MQGLAIRKSKRGWWRPFGKFYAKASKVLRKTMQKESIFAIEKKAALVLRNL